jgi:hypothetical protein
MLVPMVDVIFADVAQPDQARIVGLNAAHFLKNGGAFVISIKASCIDSTAPPEAVFAREVKKLQEQQLKPKEQVRFGGGGGYAVNIVFSALDPFALGGGESESRARAPRRRPLHTYTLPREDHIPLLATPARPPRRAARVTPLSMTQTAPCSPGGAGGGARAPIQTSKILPPLQI